MKIPRAGCNRTYFIIIGIAWTISLLLILSLIRPYEESSNLDASILEATKKLQLLKQKQATIVELLRELSTGLKDDDKEKVFKSLKIVNQTEYSLMTPTLDLRGTFEYERLRRRLYSNTWAYWHFIASRFEAFFPDGSPLRAKASSFIDLSNQHLRSLIGDITALTKSDGFAEWRKNEEILLSDLVQRRLFYLQNPPNCNAAKKLLCNLNKGCGYGCQLHHVVYCFIVAYGTKRTLILKSKGWRYARRSGWEKYFLPLSDSCVNESGPRQSWPGHNDSMVITLPVIDSLVYKPPYLPLHIPADLADKLMVVHGDPVVWWIGQFLKYMLRPQVATKDMLDAYAAKVNFRKPIVGVHIRRTDKVGSEADFHQVSEYMTHVREYYNTLQASLPNSDVTSSVVKRVYLASDDPSVFKEVKKRFGDEFEIIGDARISASASVRNRYTETSLYGIITDIHFLSMCDFLVCTFSSQVCRTAYEIMNSMGGDASANFRSLDDIYYFGGQPTPRYEVAVLAHTPSSLAEDEIELRVGDVLTVAGNHWNGYKKGTNMRTMVTGLYPTFKTIPEVSAAEFPTYPEVPIIMPKESSPNN